MQWEEFDAPGVGPKMLFPMAWSLLPLTVGLILLVRSDGLLPTVLLGSGNYAIPCCCLARSE